MTYSFKQYAFVVCVVLAWLFAPCASAGVHDVGPIDEPSQALTAEVAGSGDHAAEGLDKALTDDKSALTEMPTVPEMSTWAMLLLWFVGAGLGIFRGSRKRAVPHFE
jgi:hypothetical protein